MSLTWSQFSRCYGCQGVVTRTSIYHLPKVSPTLFVKYNSKILETKTENTSWVRNISCKFMNAKSTGSPHRVSPPNAKMSVLVIGAAGAVGKRLIGALAARGGQVNEILTTKTWYFAWSKILAALWLPVIFLRVFRLWMWNAIIDSHWHGIVLSIFLGGNLFGQVNASLLWTKHQSFQTAFEIWWCMRLGGKGGAS